MRKCGLRGNTPKAAIDNSLEAMIPVLRGERPVIIPADAYREIRSAVDFANEFGLKLVIAGGMDAWKLADLLAKNKFGCCLRRCTTAAVGRRPV
jgi:hypothetical protein